MGFSLSKLLRRHPFPVVASFERVVAVSFAFPETALRPLLSRGLEIDTFNGLGFITVAMVWTKNLRPAGFPKCLGQDFFLSGYRIFTRLQDGDRRLRGLQILRSETDQSRMVRLGNLLTHYHYRRVDVSIAEAVGKTRVQTSLRDGAPSLDLTFSAASESSPLPVGSPFSEWKQARLFSGPMPFTFSAEDDQTFVVIEGSRQHWVPTPVCVMDWHVAFFGETPLQGFTPILANAFAVNNVSYRWKRGRVVRLGDSK